MRGDFSRLTFRRENHFSGVRLQQGRVQLDAEFNEQVDIEAYRDRETARDVIGPAGAPQDGGGFRVGIAAMLRGAAVATGAWAVGEDGTILRAGAGDASWTLAARPAGSQRLNAVSFGDAANGWAVGDAAAIFRLGGATAVTEAVPAGITADLHDVAAAGPASALAVGSGGVVLAYDGTDWERQALAAGVAATLRGVHAGAVPCAVGDAGTIVARTGPGGTWQVESTPADTGDLHGVFVVDAQHRWAVGEQGTILFSDGTEWSRQDVTPGVTRTLRSVVFTTAGEGTAVGDGGTIVATNDGGSTWKPQPVKGLSADLHDVVARADGTLLAVGDDVALTRDAGGTWRPAPKLPADASTGARKGRTLTLSAGDLYVDGIRCENERDVSLGTQPEPRLEGLHRAPGGAGTFGVYLQVQEQHLTAVEREELREAALGGPDTATRTRTVWQADLVRMAAGSPGCADIAEAARPRAARGRLRARTQPSEVSTSGCIVPPTGGYERLENQLYRVEIHDADAPSFKWSRDNGSMVARLLAIETKPGQGGGAPTGSVTVSTTGRDATLGFGTEQLVEITDEGRMLRGEPGVLAEVRQVEGKLLLLENVRQHPLTLADFPDRPLVRRWDGSGDVNGTEQELESGVFVQFAGDGELRSGDYWTIPARSLKGAIEWPSQGGVPTFEEPHGPDLHMAPLALVELDAQGVWSVVRECRKQFPGLTDLVHMVYLGGDGQEVVPTYPLSSERYFALDQPLRVGVANGRRGVAKAAVEFEVVKGGGRLSTTAGALGTKVTVATDPDGVAECAWELAGAEHVQAAVARFLDPLGQSPPQEIAFTAHLSIARKVAYDGDWCARLADDVTVQDAIDSLARLVRLFPISGSGEDVRPGGSVSVSVLVADQCGPVGNATVSFAVTRGSGAIDEVAGTTNESGVASCRWTPDPAEPTHELTATLDALPEGPTLHVPAETRFVANVRSARHIAYDPPSRCPELQEIETVQDAIDRLVRLLPRLFHVSGNGHVGSPGEHVLLRVGIGNRCGVGSPQVRFERREEPDEGGRDRSGWTALATVGEDDEQIATLDYELTPDRFQLVRAQMVLPRRETPVGDPVYFNLGAAAEATRKVPTARIFLEETEQLSEQAKWTVIDFREARIIVDTHGMFDPGGDPTRLSVKQPGRYLVTGNLSWDADATGSRSLMLGENGGWLASVHTPPAAGNDTVQNVSGVSVIADEGDWFELRAWQRNESRTSLPVSRASLTAIWLGS